MSNSSDILDNLGKVIEERKQKTADESYVATLFAGGIDTILQKIGEEAAETVIAGKNGNPDRIVYEVADLWFHSLILLAHYDLAPADVLKELERRFGRSGLDEKAARNTGHG
ncbi:MAG: phosphoribosyl-ATP diphosphatase [Gammaproteobacteria bacterium]|nr:phosphoribosyl-ATP diphosphatase [Gammaproteobacteria bacterium]